MRPLADGLLVAHEAIGLDAPGGALGRVLDVGSDLEPERGRWIDRRVLIPGLRACGACLPCRRGHPSLCQRLPPSSPLQDRGQVAARLVVALGEGVPLPADPLPFAILGGVGLLAYAAVVRAGVEPNRAALVLGRGPLALLVAALVEHRGAKALRIDSPTADSARAIDSSLAESGIESFGLPLIDTGLGLEHALRLARPGGAVVLCTSDATPTSAALVVEQELAVHGLRGAHPDLLPELCAFAATGALPLGSLVRVVPKLGDLGDPDAAPADERARLWVPASTI